MVLQQPPDLPHLLLAYVVPDAVQSRVPAQLPQVAAGVALSPFGNLLQINGVTELQRKR